MKVAIRADGNQNIGMGHIMRCMAIADALIKKCCEVTFIISPDTDTSVITGTEMRVMRLNESGKLGWSPDETVELIKKEAFDCLLVDSYRVDAIALKKLNDVIDCFYIDDIYAFDYPIKNIINHNLEAKEDNYSPSVFDRNLYIGPQYFPIRKQVRDSKVHSLRKDFKTVLVTTGSTDPFGIELDILRNIVPQYPNLFFKVLLGIFYDESYIEEIRDFAQKFAGIEILGWTKEMGELFSSVDLVIGPGSTTLLEAFTVGTPCVSYSFVDNHINQCRAMDEMRLGPYCGDYRDDPTSVCGAIDDAIKRANPVDTRNGWRARYGSIFDGKGAERIASLIVNHRSDNSDKNAPETLKNGTFRIGGGRASSILYNFLLSNKIEGKALIPANICETVPAIYLKAGMEIEFCDIEFGSWVPDEKQIKDLLRKDRTISVLHYSRTYGDSSDHTDFLMDIRENFPDIIIIEDACLSMPQLSIKEFIPDLLFFSTGKTKPVNIGGGAFGFLNAKYRYDYHNIDCSVEENDMAFDASIKRCHSEHLPAEMEIMLSDWFDPGLVPEDGYYDKVEKELTHIREHKNRINAIYSVLPDSLPERFRDWRYCILVRNQQECLDALFEAGLFASKHYMSLGNGYFDPVETPNCDWLESHVINLFNDTAYTEDMAKKTVEIIMNTAKYI